MAVVRDEKNHHQHGGHAAPTPALAKKLNCQSVIRDMKKNHLYIYKKGIRYALSTYDVFKKLELVELEVVNELPDAVLQTIPLGPQLTPENLNDFCMKKMIDCPDSFFA